MTTATSRDARRLLRGRVEQLGEGFGFTEGPVWDAREGRVIFSDMAHDHMRSWHRDTGFATLRRPSNKANGNALDGLGRLISCEHATSRVVRQESDGTLTVLASHFEGQELNSPNDVIVSSSGAIFFTDPTYGRIREDLGLVRPTQLAHRGVYCIAASGELTLVAADFEQPNGLCLGQDERVLFVNDTARKHIRRFELRPDGRWNQGEVWAQVGGEGMGVPDGMKLAAGGTVLCTGPGGIQLFEPDGSLAGVIPVPEKVTNFCWAGSASDSLFVTATTSVFMVHGPAD